MAHRSESRWALITGASSGIGEELARLFAADRINVALVARREERLRKLASELSERHRIATHVLQADLASAEAPQQIVDELAGRSVEVEYLVNNAGFGTNGAFAEMDARSQLDMLQVNIASLVHLTHLLLPGMIRRKSGRVLNVASLAAFQPGPYMAVYYASKAFVLSFSEAIHEECRKCNVTTTCLCPGPTHTEFAETAGMGSAPLFKMGPMSAPAVAGSGYRAMHRGSPVVVTGTGNKTLAFSVRFAPRSLVRQITKRLNRTG